MTVSDLERLSEIFSDVMVSCQYQVTEDSSFHRASRVSIPTRYIDTSILSVCPSVRLSVCLSDRYVPVFYENGLTYCHSFFTTL